MKTILRFINYHGIFRINHFIGDDHISAHGQTVHKNRVARFLHLRFVNNPIAAQLRTKRQFFFRIAIEIFASPAFCIDNLNIVESRLHVIYNF